MSREINMEGIEPHQELLKTLKNFKQGSLLEESYHRVHVEYTREMVMDFKHYGLSEEAVDLRIKRDMVEKIITDIYPQLHSKVKITTTPFDGLKYELGFVLMDQDHLKHIVEYCVRTMPEQAIKEIRQ